jgi:hypothetical protein
MELSPGAAVLVMFALFCIVVIAGLVAVALDNRRPDAGAVLGAVTVRGSVREPTTFRTATAVAAVRDGRIVVRIDDDASDPTLWIEIDIAVGAPDPARPVPFRTA